MSDKKATILTAVPWHCKHESWHTGPGPQGIRMWDFRFFNFFSYIFIVTCLQDKNYLQDQASRLFKLPGFLGHISTLKKEFLNLPINCSGMNHSVSLTSLEMTKEEASIGQQ